MTITFLVVSKVLAEKGRKVHFAKVLLLLLGLCVKMSEIGANQMGILFALPEQLESRD
jgi:hypothetical protein